MFRVIQELLPTKVFEAEQGYVFLMDEEEDYFVYFQFHPEGNKFWLEEYLENYSSRTIVSIEHLDDVLYEALVLLSSYDRKLNSNSSYKQLLRLYFSKTNASQTISI